MKKKLTLIMILSFIILFLLGANYFCFFAPDPLLGKREHIFQQASANVESDNSLKEELLPSSTDSSQSSTPTVDFNEIITLPAGQADSTSQDAISEQPAFEEYDIQLMALGDNLIHMGIVYTGLQNDGTYNFDCLFDGVKDFLAISDVKIINQETPMAGNELGFSGFPLFNSPSEVGDAIANCGFNVVLAATNHSADQGTDGIDHMVAFWKNHPEVLLMGIHEPLDSMPEPDQAQDSLVSHASSNPRIGLLQVKDVTIAVLNVTYGPNYGSLPNSLAMRMDTLCATQPDSIVLDYTSINPQVLEDIKTAKSISDFVIVCPHWGTEYALTPSTYQKTFAEQMTEAGADLIIGTHPHVPEPIEWVTSANGNHALCYYSLGNYVSTQQNPDSMLEGMAWVSLKVTENGVQINEEKTGVIPMVCHYRSNPTRLKNVYMLEDYSEELANAHGIHSAGVSFSLSYLQQLSNEVFREWSLSPQEILSNSNP